MLLIFGICNISLESDSLMVRLNGDGFYARSTQPEDEKGFYALYSNAQVMKNLCSGEILTDAKAKERAHQRVQMWVERAKAKDVRCCLAVFTSDDQFMGIINAFNDGRPGCAEVSCAYLPAFWNQHWAYSVGLAMGEWTKQIHQLGLGKQQIDGMQSKDFWFLGKPLTSLSATASPENIASWSLLKSTGFVADEYELREGEQVMQSAKIERNGSFVDIGPITSDTYEIAKAWFMQKPDVRHLITTPEGGRWVAKFSKAYGDIKYCFYRLVEESKESNLDT